MPEQLRGGRYAIVRALGEGSQGETFEELLQNLYEAVEGCLSVDVDAARNTERDRVLEIALMFSPRCRAFDRTSGQQISHRPALAES